MNLANRNSLRMRKQYIYFGCRDSSKHRDQLLLFWSGYEEARLSPFPARRTQASEPKYRLTAFGLVAKRRTECARVNMSWCVVFHNMYNTSTYPRRGARRVTWSLGPSPRQPTVVCAGRDALSARRARRNAAIQLPTSNPSIVLLLFAVLFLGMYFFDWEI